MKIEKKTALITGATSGIGKSVAELLAKNGANLIITGRRLERLDNIAADISKKYNVSVDCYNFDVRNRASVEDFSKKIADSGKDIDIFINNAGLASGLSPLQAGDIDDWEVMIDTNIKGFLYMARGILPIMVKKNIGHIVNVGSIAGYQVYPGGNVYNATKFAVRALSDAMNLDLLKTEVKVTSIEPGMVETEFSDIRFKGDKERADKTYQGLTPLKAEDIANTIVYAIQTPDHVNIQHILITPVAQRSAYFVNRI